MPMTAAGLQAAMQAQLGAATDPTLQAEVLLKLATAIVVYIQTNGTIAVVGVQTGSGTAAGTIS